MDKDFECIVVDTNNEEYDIILPSDIFTTSELEIRKMIGKELDKDFTKIEISRLDAMFKIVLKEKKED